MGGLSHRQIAHQLWGEQLQGTAVTKRHGLRRDIRELIGVWAKLLLFRLRQDLLSRGPKCVPPLFVVVDGSSLPHCGDEVLAVRLRWVDLSSPLLVKEVFVGLVSAVALPARKPRPKGTKIPKQKNAAAQPTAKKPKAEVQTPSAVAAALGVKPITAFFAARGPLPPPSASEPSSANKPAVTVKPTIAKGQATTTSKARCSKSSEKVAAKPAPTPNVQSSNRKAAAKPAPKGSTAKGHKKKKFGATGEAAFDAIDEVLKQMSLHPRHVYGWSSDDGSTMTGRDNGAAALMGKAAGRSLAMSMDAAHRMQTKMKILLDCPAFKDMTSVLRQINSIFRGSNLLRRALEDAMGHKMPKPDASWRIRWMKKWERSFANACTPGMLEGWLA
ncbi:hypothetical protein DIPPA_22447, partial [Diplonema papillatum]